MRAEYGRNFRVTLSGTGIHVVRVPPLLLRPFVEAVEKVRLLRAVLDVPDRANGGAIGLWFP